MTNKTILYLFSGILISALFLWYSLKDIQLSQLEYAYLNASPLLILLMLLSFVVFFYLKAYRWKLLLAPISSFHTNQMIPPLILGTAVHYATTSYLGDIVRMLSASKWLHIRKSSILATIFLERILDSLTLILLITTLGLFQKSLPPSFTKGIIILFTLTIILFAFILLAVFLPKKLDPLLRLLEKWLPAKIYDALIHAFKGFQSVASLHLVTKISALSLLQWLLMGTAHYLSIVALGINIPFYAAFIVMAFIVCGFILPNAPGQIGLIEFCYVIALGHFGVPSSLALAAAILYHVLLYVMVILWACFYSKSAALLFKDMTKKFQAQDTHEN